MPSYPLIAILGALALTACAAETSEATDATVSEESGEAAGNQDSAATPDSFAETAWISRSEDGARFITFFDADGTYREMRNGDPRQTGEWSFAEGPEGKQVCVQPDAEAGVKSCWRPDKMKDGNLIVVGPEGKRVELQRADYSSANTEDAVAQ